MLGAETYDAYGPVAGGGNALVAVFWYGIFVLLPAGILALVSYYLLSLPMRRRDRALFFLDLMETALARGQSPEHAILSAAETRDRVMGVQFFLLAAHIEAGCKLGEALERTPRFLPPQIAAILRTGEVLGDFKKVLPACRETLRVAPESVHKAVHYMMMLLLVFAPVSIWLMTILPIFVYPKYLEIAASMNVPVYPVARFVISFTPMMVLFEAVMFFFLLACLAVYLGGPGFVRWFQCRSLPVVDWLAWRIPWKRKGLQRTFSAMLAVLLDGGVPEPEAVRLAGAATANEICRRRAGRVIQALEQGSTLGVAIRVFDDSGEFHWRLANAIHARGGFLPALRGWHEALDAKAFQEQEAATQFFTSGLILVNGIIVGLVATCTFGFLITFLRAMTQTQ